MAKSKQVLNFAMRPYLFASRFVADARENRKWLHHVIIEPANEGVYIIGSDAGTLVCFHDIMGNADRAYCVAPGRNTDWKMPMDKKGNAVARIILKDGELVSTVGDNPVKRPYEVPEDIKPGNFLEVIRESLNEELKPNLDFEIPSDVFTKFNVPPALSPLSNPAADRRIHIRFYTTKEFTGDNPAIILSSTDPHMMGLVMPSRWMASDRSAQFTIDDCVAIRHLKGAPAPKPEDAGGKKNKKNKKNKKDKKKNKEDK